MVYVSQDHSLLDKEVGLLWGGNIHQDNEDFGGGFSKAGMLTAYMDELNLT